MKPNLCLLGALIAMTGLSRAFAFQTPAASPPTKETPALHTFVFRASPESPVGDLTWAQKQERMRREGFVRSRGADYESYIDPRLLTIDLVNALSSVLALLPDQDGSIRVTAQRLGKGAQRQLGEILSRAPFGRSLAQKNQERGLRISVVPYATLGVVVDGKTLFVSLDDRRSGPTDGAVALPPKALSSETTTTMIVQRIGPILPSEIVDGAMDRAMADLRARRKAVKQKAEAALEHSCRLLMDPYGKPNPKEFSQLSPEMQSRFRDQIAKEYKALGFKSLPEALSAVEAAPIKSLRFDADVVVFAEGSGEASIFALKVLRW